MRALEEWPEPQAEWGCQLLRWEKVGGDEKFRYALGPF